MQKLTQLHSLVCPLDRANIDTDAIIPKQFLKSIERTGFGPHLFDEWRYLDKGELGMDASQRPLNPDFSLNDTRYASAQILLTRENFGCGSSREHAPWALADYGFRVIIAPSFADIFYNNCIKNGILLVALAADELDELFAISAFGASGLIGVDLEKQVVCAAGKKFPSCLAILRSRCTPASRPGGAGCQRTGGGPSPASGSPALCPGPPWFSPRTAPRTS
jgi:3-isopropylmalate/(R)-2-methylmalate dehydratase small subunit